MGLGRFEDGGTVLGNGITAHVADLGQPLLAETTGLRTGWATLITASASASGAKTGTQEGKQLARENLQLMLFLNLLKLAEVFPRRTRSAPCACTNAGSIVRKKCRQPSACRNNDLPLK